MLQVNHFYFPLIRSYLFQCIIPVIEGIFLKYEDKILKDLFFTLNHWHSLAKLHLHTDSTAGKLLEVTKQVGNLLCKFRKSVCVKYITKELPSEVNARGHRKALLASKNPKSDKKTTTKDRVRRKFIKFNFSTYKGHVLADYARYVHHLGTTDNYSTQTIWYTLLIMVGY